MVPPQYLFSSAPVNYRTSPPAPSTGPVATRKSPSPPSRHPRLRHKHLSHSMGKPYMVPSPLAGPPHVIQTRYAQQAEHSQAA